MTFIKFLQELSANYVLAITTILTLAVILVNGSTDAPNAIATCVSTKVMSPKKAIMMASVFNFLGVLFMSLLSRKVAYTISTMVNFSGDYSDALAALCAAMVGIVIWASVSWFFGIPTSESHALIAGLSGAAIALQGGIIGINKGEWVKVIYGLLLSTFLGFFMGFIISKIILVIFRKQDKQKTLVLFKYAQIGGSASMAFMHGAQDGLKFIGVFMLGTFLSQGKVLPDSFNIPLWLMILCSLVMGIGTLIGGNRIIKTIGMNMVKLEKYQGFASDLAAASCLLISTLFGLPVSTTHTKTTAIMGSAASKRLSSIRWEVVTDMVISWILTFPGCGLIGYIVFKIFILFF